MSYEDYRCLDVAIREGVAFVSIDHPPINLFDTKLMAEMDRLGREFEDDAAVRVIVFQSRDPDFFIAHADVNLIQRLPSTAEEKSEELNFFHAMVERFRSMPKATIGKIEGCARGGGSEFLLSLDMRFGALGRCVLSQPEVAIGILPGGSGTQHLPRLMGRGRALEVILGCEDFDAETAERYGWINRALPPDELGPSSSAWLGASLRFLPRRSLSRSARWRHRLFRSAKVSWRRPGASSRLSPSLPRARSWRPSCRGAARHEKSS